MLLSIVMLVIYQLLVVNLAVLKLDVKTDTRTLFKVYYKDTAGQWAEEKAGFFIIKPGTSKYSLRLTDIREMEELRIDTSESPATVTVHSIEIQQPGFQPIILNSEKQFQKLRVGTGIEEYSYSNDGFRVAPSTRDPQLYYTLPELQPVNDLRATVMSTIAIVLLAFLLVVLAYRLGKDYGFVLCWGTIACTLIVVMAAISSYNKHPDEMVHVAAAGYFIDHSLPPEVGAEDIRHTYSPYGVSRLHSGEIAYFFAGKFAKLLEPLQLPLYLAVRYFNVALFAVLLCCGLLSVQFRILLIPLMLSPQIWYIFSYFNSEAFAVFIILMAAFQMVHPRSWWNRLMDMEEDFPLASLALAGLGILLGLVFLLKKNFYFFVVFLFFYLVWRILFKKVELTRTVFFRACSILLIGGCIFGAVRGFDAYVNDFKKSEKILEAREQYAQKIYKPSTPLEKKLYYLQMKERGVTIKGAMEDMRWGERIFRSSFGEYGYTNVAGTLNYYDIVRYSSIALAGVVLLSICIFGRFEGIALLSVATVCSVVLMAMAFYHAWAVDFQAQGRYFLPIIGMLSILTYHQRKSLANFPCYVMATTMFLLSVYSYVFVALAGIGKLTIPIG